MIKSFADAFTEKVFLAQPITKKERKIYGGLDLAKTKRKLDMLAAATERDLLMVPSMHYHKLQGTERYSIDAFARNSPWRITFAWNDDELTDVKLVKIEDTH